jgi:hypothetical protein
LLPNLCPATTHLAKSAYEFWAKNKIFIRFSAKGHISFPRTQDGINANEILISPRLKAKLQDTCARAHLTKCLKNGVITSSYESEADYSESNNSD